MSFWSNIDNPEPLRQFRWYITFGNPNGYSKTNKEDIIPLDNFTFALKECVKPSFKIDTSQHVLLNHTFNYPKNLVWNPVTVTFVSAFNENGLSVSQTLQRILQASGYSTPDSDFNIQNQISKQKASFPKIELKQIDENGSINEIWVLKNSFINDINYGNLSYNSEDLVEVKINIVYDYAQLTTTEDTLDKAKELSNQIEQQVAADRLATQNVLPTISLGEVNGNNIRVGGLSMRTANVAETEEE